MREVDLSSDGQPFVSWLAATSQTASTFSGTPGSRYRFRVRATDAFGNVSEWVTTHEVEVASGTDGDGTGKGSPTPPDPAGTVLLSPELRITSIRRTARRLTVHGTVARGANGKLTATWTPRRRGRPVRATTYAQLRAFSLRLAIPRKERRARRGVLVVRYNAGGGFRAQSRRMTVTSRGS
jgi:hypothetical protein